MHAENRNMVQIENNQNKDDNKNKSKVEFKQLHKSFLDYIDEDQLIPKTAYYFQNYLLRRAIISASFDQVLNGKKNTKQFVREINYFFSLINYY